MTITLSEVEQIANIVKDLPLNNWIINFTSGDLKVRWHENVSRYLLLHRSLSSYFSGDEAFEHNLSKELREFITLWRDDYIALYTLIRECWTEIWQQPISDDLPFPNTPGEMIQDILLMECWGYMIAGIPHLDTFSKNPYSHTSSQKIYRTRNEIKKLSQELKEHSTEEISKSLMLRIDKISRDSSDIYQYNWCFLFRNYCHRIAKVVANHDSIVKRQLLKYELAHEEFVDNLYRRAHPRKNLKLRGYDKQGNMI